VVQESFLKAFGALSSFKAGSNFQAWLFRIAYNGFATVRRAERSTRQRFPRDVAAFQKGPDEQMINQEQLEAVARAVGRLPRDFRAAFLLRAEQGLAYREIASVFGIREETARWRVFKARQKLMDTLASQLD